MKNIWDYNDILSYTIMLPEAFSIEECTFQEKDEWPIQIDSHFSDEEKWELKEFLDNGCNQIHDETQWKLGEFLSSEVLPNIDTADFTAVQKESLQALGEKHIDRINFDISTPELLEKLINEAGLSILFVEDTVNLAESYMTQNFQLPPDASMTKDKHKEKIRQINIWIQTIIDWVSIVIEETISDYPDRTPQELRWIINTRVTEYLDNSFAVLQYEVIDPVIDEITYSSDIQRSDDIQRDLQAYYEDQANKQGLIWEEYDAYISENIEQQTQWFERLYQRLLRMADSQNMSEKELQNRYDLLLHTQPWAEYGTDYRTQESIISSDDVSILNEEDQMKEAEAGFYSLCATSVQCLPYVWAVWIVTDAMDVFSSQDATTELLKDAWLIDANYNIEKWLLDNFIAWASVALTAVWLQALAKSWKIAKAVESIEGISKSDIPWYIEKFLEKMNFPDEIWVFLKKLMWSDAREAPNSPKVESTIPANQNRPEWMRATNDNTLQVHERTQKYDTVEAYESAWGNATEYGYVDTNGVLHVNTAELAKLDPKMRRTEMKELIAHERAHQALMNQEAGTVWRMNEVFMRNDVYTDCAEYVDYARVENPLDVANELFATMAWRLRVGKEVPQSFIDAMVEWWFAKIDPQTGKLDLSTNFWVEAVRREWVENGWVRNVDELSSAAMKKKNNRFWISNIAWDNLRKSGTLDILDTLFDNVHSVEDVLELVKNGTKINAREFNLNQDVTVKMNDTALSSIFDFLKKHWFDDMTLEYGDTYKIEGYGSISKEGDEWQIHDGTIRYIWEKLAAIQERLKVNPKDIEKGMQESIAVFSLNTNLRIPGLSTIYLQTPSELKEYVSSLRWVQGSLSGHLNMARDAGVSVDVIDIPVWSTQHLRLTAKNSGIEVPESLLSWENIVVTTENYDSYVDFVESLISPMEKKLDEVVHLDRAREKAERVKITEISEQLSWTLEGLWKVFTSSINVWERLADKQRLIWDLWERLAWLTDFPEWKELSKIHEVTWKWIKAEAERLGIDMPVFLNVPDGEPLPINSHTKGDLESFLAKLWDKLNPRGDHLSDENWQEIMKGFWSIWNLENIEINEKNFDIVAVEAAILNINSILEKIELWTTQKMKIDCHKEIVTFYERLANIIPWDTPKLPVAFANNGRVNQDSIDTIASRFKEILPWVNNTWDRWAA